MAKNVARSGVHYIPVKVTQPVMSQALPRSRLFDKIDRLMHHQVIWVSSPAGSGKTTLISTYLESRRIPCLWYQVDIGDDDPATFFHYLGRAAIVAIPRVRRSFPALTPEYLLGLPAFTLRFFEDICKYLIEGPSRSREKATALKAHFALVFDNYQDVQEASPFHTIITTGLSRVPLSIKVFLISRLSFPPVYARLQANGQMGMLGWDDLMLSHDETEAILCMKSCKDVPKETITHVHEVTEGWAAGITLMAGALERDELYELPPSGSTPDEIMFYFGSELFDKLDQPTKDFLLKTAFLPRMTAQMARELTGNVDSDRILGSLYKNNFFIHKHLKAEPSYEYHPLFRKFLINAAKTSITRDDMSQIIRSAASMLERNGQLEATMELLKEVSVWEDMVPAIIKHAPVLIEQGRYRVLQDWLSSVPDDVVEKNPWLFYWKGSAILPFDPINSKMIFEKAYTTFTAAGDMDGVLLSLSGITQSIQLSYTDFKQYDPWIPIIEHLFNTIDTFPSQVIESLLLDDMLTALVLRQPDHPNIETYIKRVTFMLDQPIANTTKARLLFAMFFYSFSKCDYPMMDRIFERIKHLSKSKNITPMAVALMNLGEILYHILMANYQECLQTYKRLQNLSQETGMHVLDNLFSIYEVQSLLDQNSLQQAQEIIKTLSDKYELLLMREKRSYHWIKARACMIGNQYEQALLDARKALEISVAMGSVLDIANSHLCLAQALHFAGSHEEEFVHLNLGTNNIQRIKDSSHHIYAIFWKAFCSFERGDRATGNTFLRQAFALGRQHSLTATFVDIPSVTSQLCVRAIEAGIEPGYARWLIRKRKFTMDPPPYHLEGWPWPVKISTLGRFAIAIDDKALTFPKRAQNKPLEVLKIIISGGGANVSEVHVADTLWPDAEGDMAMQSLATNLHRLRKLLGHHDTVLLQNGILSLDKNLCWIDARAFEYSLSRADALWEKALSERDIDEACRYFCSSIELYLGEFLPDDQWIPDVLAMREYLHMKFLKALSRAGEHMVKTGQYDKARQAIEYGLDIDGCAEELYRLLMLCLQCQGHKADALTVYERCRKTLHVELGTAPSAETETLARSLRT